MHDSRNKIGPLRRKVCSSDAELLNKGCPEGGRWRVRGFGRARREEIPIAGTLAYRVVLAGSNRWKWCAGENPAGFDAPGSELICVNVLTSNGPISIAVPSRDGVSQGQARGLGPFTSLSSGAPRDLFWEERVI